MKEHTTATTKTTTTTNASIDWAEARRLERLCHEAAAIAEDVELVRRALAAEDDGHPGVGALKRAADRLERLSEALLELTDERIYGRDLGDAGEPQ